MFKKADIYNKCKKNYKMVKNIKIYVALLCFLLFLNLALGAENHIISNSDNWRDVFSSVHYANLNGYDSDFLVSTKHGPLLLEGLLKDQKYTIISSDSRAYVLNYKDMMEGADFSDVNEIEVSNANLELIEEMPQINNFVIVGNDYGYYAVSAAPYAVKRKSWIFFADRNNIDEIDNLLDGRDVEEVLIYGNLDREVFDTLEKYNPKTINNGDRFVDNVKIVDLYLGLNPTKQILLTNGEFIEKEIMAGIEPILFTGKENVPDQIRDYIKASDIEVGVLIGSDLVGAATNIRRSTGISVIAKFARGARQNTGAIATVEGLDLFYLPTPVVSLTLHSARYNKATNQLEVTYKSESNVPIYFKGTITYDGEDGQRDRVGDAESVYISPNDYKTMIYDNVVVRNDNLTIDIFTLYGEASNSLDKILESRIEVDVVDVIDGCNLDLLSIKYDKNKDEFEVNVKSLSDVTCYADVELKNVIVDSEETTIGFSGSEKIEPNKKKKIKIPFELTDEDIEKNEYIDVYVYYGEKEDSLTKLIKGKLKLEVKGLLFIILMIILAILIIAILIFLILLWRKRRNEDGF